ncbi:hypothetical protein ETD86_43065 [Nonomuraea turkmeniaca]|uniref:Uncharacterized protein n=1 Tax=Nonomuraea turkmeniaca TaxID=103838 RepID=A0A5S4F0M1_9ACTN|nr:hypothetical protein [Nonomuraea turkmeniaca]TMR09572.1 hypothetical protein ETD86_43065 [Nonomuraea turkmeniaca]
MPERDDSESGKLAKALLWLGTLVTAVATAWATDVFGLVVRPADLLGAGKPPMLATVLPGTGHGSDLAVAALPGSPRDRAVFLSGRFEDEAFIDVAARLGGAWVNRMTVRVVLESNRDLIRVTDVRVKEISPRQPIVTHAFVEFPQEGVSDNPQLSVDLNSRDKFFAGAQKPGRPFFGDHSLSLKRGQQTELGLEIEAGAHSHTFVLEVRYVEAGSGKEEIFTVTGRKGRPFRLTGAPRVYTGYNMVYRNTGAGLRPVRGRAACEIFMAGRACAAGR